MRLVTYHARTRRTVLPRGQLDPDELLAGCRRDVLVRSGGMDVCEIAHIIPVHGTLLALPSSSGTSTESAIPDDRRARNLVAVQRARAIGRGRPQVTPSAPPALSDGHRQPSRKARYWALASAQDSGRRLPRRPYAGHTSNRTPVHHRARPFPERGDERWRKTPIYVDWLSRARAMTRSKRWLKPGRSPYLSRHGR